MTPLVETSIHGYATRDAPASHLRRLTKRIVFRLAKQTGVFRLSRAKTGQGLRILCYHGFSIEDEHLFRPRLFMQAATFRRRMEYLRHNSYPVLSLDEALDRLDAGTLPSGATVITIDDGFYSVHSCAAPILRELSLPATMYVATSEFLRGLPVFRLVVQYMFWKTGKGTLDPSGLTREFQAQISLNSPEDRHRIMWGIVQFGDSLDSDLQRSALASELGLRLGLDYGEMAKRRLFCIMDSQELRDLAASGIDLQLHTHTHHFPEDSRLAAQEIQRNREVLGQITSRPLRHFCYPSGIWSEKHWPALRTAEILSATTCRGGFNYAITPRLALNRFLDSNDILQVEFEAEMTGFSEQLRQARARLGTKSGA
jgi:peptidoglycan/xylan/chitin deacetylase (PgdA/CDA1 family)